MVAADLQMYYPNPDENLLRLIASLQESVEKRDEAKRKRDIAFKKYVSARESLNRAETARSLADDAVFAYLRHNGYAIVPDAEILLAFAVAISPYRETGKFLTAAETARRCDIPYEKARERLAIVREFLRVSARGMKKPEPRTESEQFAAWEEFGRSCDPYRQKGINPPR